jgi:hypothetical protein
VQAMSSPPNAMRAPFSTFRRTARRLSVMMRSNLARADYGRLNPIASLPGFAFSLRLPMQGGTHDSIANALETIATGLLSAAESSVTRPKLMVRPRRTTRASASTSDDITARMKCVVWSTVVIGR